MGCENHNNFFVNQIYMANNKFSYRMEHKQRLHSGDSVHSLGFGMQLFNIKRVNKMAQSKMIWLICDFLGIPLSILGIIANMDNVKSAIIAVLGITYLMIRMYFYMIKAKQDVKEKDLDLWHKEMDKNDREEERKNKQNKK